MPRNAIRKSTIALAAGGVAVAATMILASAVRAQPQGRCAFVDAGLLPGYSAPEFRCFKLDMTCPATAHSGCFKGPLEFAPGWVEKPGQPRRRQLAQPFGYIDPTGLHWDVPAGALTDGASIPLFFQPFIGGPWTEGYVKAATLHDFYIRRRTANAAEVHRMFYLALLASGTSANRAAQMYAAVANFGPQWRNVDVAQVEAMWRSRKAALDEITRIHKEIWDRFQEDEKKRAAQAAIDQALLARPLASRTRVFSIRSEAAAAADLEAFLAAAQADNLLHPIRDVTMMQSFRERLAIELRRPAGERDNVLVLRFMRTGPQLSHFPARTEAELKESLALDAQISEQLDKALIDAFEPRSANPRR